MNVDIEEMLRRELREVSSGLTIPERPALPREPVRSRRRIGRLTLAAVVALLVVGAGAVVLSYRDGGTAQPATPSPTPTERPTVRPLTAGAPTVPHVLDGRLYVAGERLPGSWWTVDQAGGVWVAQRDDGTWWWGDGTGVERHAVSGTVILQPRLSPDGGLLAVSTITQSGGQVLLIDTRSGETVDTLPMEASGPSDPDVLGVVAVTTDAKVFLESDSRRLMWLVAGDEDRGGGERTVDLDVAAPEQWVRGSTSAGLIVYDGTKEGDPDASYLAEVSDTGALDRLRALPGENVEVNPSGTWLAHGGSWGGESQTIDETMVQTFDGSRRVVLSPPDERQLLVVTWEDDDLLLAELHTDGVPTGLARCSVREEECLVLDVP